MRVTQGIEGAYIYIYCFYAYIQGVVLTYRLIGLEGLWDFRSSS